MIVIVVFLRNSALRKVRLLGLSMELAICESGDLDIVSPTKEDFQVLSNTRRLTHWGVDDDIL